MSKHTVLVTQEVVVEIDDSKFTPEFIVEFSKNLYDFDLNEHIEHLAQLHARGLGDEHSFIEGYGPAKAMGIKLDLKWCEAELQKAEA